MKVSISNYITSEVQLLSLCHILVPGSLKTNINISYAIKIIYKETQLFSLSVHSFVASVGTI